MHTELAAGPLSAEPGHILMRDRNDNWYWTDPNSFKWRLRFVLYGVVSFIVGCVVALVLLTAIAFADEIPGGLTCSQARGIALSVGASLTWDRERARVIAASYGYDMTEAQLNALERCFDSPTPQHRKGASK